MYMLLYRKHKIYPTSKCTTGVLYKKHLCFCQEHLSINHGSSNVMKSHMPSFLDMASGWELTRNVKHGGSHSSSGRVTHLTTAYD